MIASSKEIPPTEILGEFGQINSAYQDSKFTISQTIHFPTIYKRQKELNTEIFKENTFQVAFKENDLIKQVKERFFQLVYLKEKEKLLEQAEAVYRAFLEKATFRYTKGESTILEKIFSETALGKCQMQLNMLRKDYMIEKLKWQVLLNQESDIVPDNQVVKLPMEEVPIQFTPGSNPQVKILQQQSEIAKATTQLEITKKLPDLTIAYSNVSIQGIGADEVFYKKSNRFNSLQLGVAVPLFPGAQKAKINGSKSLELMSENNLQVAIQQLSSEFNIQFQAYEKMLETLTYYEKVALPNIEVMKKTANLQFSTGEINYLTWANLIQNAIATESEYLDLVHEWNRVIIQLQFLSAN
jgi:cobalt-zinc-cadmium resistance protein CzcA